MALLDAVSPDRPVPPLIVAAFRDHICQRSQARGSRRKTMLSHLGPRLPRLLILAVEGLIPAYALYVFAVVVVMLLVALSLL